MTTRGKDEQVHRGASLLKEMKMSGKKLETILLQLLTTGEGGIHKSKER